MSGRTPGLGRGLGALIPTGPADSGADVPDRVVIDVRDSSHEELSSVPGLALREVEVGRVVPNPKQPRTVFEPEAIAELAASVAEVGFLQPIVVRQAGDGFELVAGERRLRAAQHLGLESIPALVRQTADDDMLRDALLENLHRVQLNPLEEAAAYQQLLEEFGCTQEELASRIGKSRPAVTNSIRLLRLPAGVQRRVAAGVLSAGHARALVAVDDGSLVEALATRVVAEGLSVRALEEIIALGDSQPGGSRRRRRRSPVSPRADVEADLANRLDTKVKISGTAKRGRISIEFGSAEDFDRILAALKSPTTWS
ncbi:MAG: ParB/RepB/Spo0J family partition protein [Actinobacteria bacterium]|nr:ParB/RepB/Spo0J family partition protein [Actinomycetota bacterium]MCB9411547.1 ParB/RepB/Spo0J family partition protein [Actinomycetota bacterium]